jgi:hypothetical protein
MISLFALGATALTLYLNFRTIDDVRVMVGSIGVQTTREGGNEVSLSAPDSITFINSGTRQVAVLGAGLGVEEDYTLIGIEACRSERMNALPLNLDSFVLRPGEIVIKSTSFVSDVFRKKEADKSEIKFSNDVVGFSLCILTSIVTPDSVVERASVPLPANRDDIKRPPYKFIFQIISQTKPVKVLSN